MGQPSGRNILLGVTGSIAACKSLELAGQLVRAGHDVRVVQTPSSRHFVGEASFAAVSGNRVMWDQFDSNGESPFGHIELAGSDIFVIAPATANTIGKMAAGIADNLLLITYLAARCPVIVCPAMNHHMWNHPAVQDNIRMLEKRGADIVYPEAGSLACGDEGDGRLAEPVTIFARIQDVLGEKAPGDFEGVRVLVTAGGTREPLDSVRFIANRSSGRMGFAVAAAARSRGARVTVIAANCNLSRTPGIRYIDVVTAGEMEKVLENEVDACDVLFMAAAVSDYKVSGMQTTGKIERSKENVHLKLVPTSDIVSTLGKNKNGRLIVGFAAEYGNDKLERARQKLHEKGLDMIVYNDISRDDIGFGSNYNEMTLMDRAGNDVSIARATKEECAHSLLDEVKRTHL